MSQRLADDSVQKGDEGHEGDDAGGDVEDEHDGLGGALGSRVHDVGAVALGIVKRGVIRFDNTKDSLLTHRSWLMSHFTTKHVFSLPVLRNVNKLQGDSNETRVGLP